MQTAPPIVIASKFASFTAIIILSSLIFSVSCGQQSRGQMEQRAKLVITGSSTVAPLVNEIGKRFETLNPGVRIDVQTGGSSRGISDVRQNVADIGMVSRSAKHKEHDLHWFPLAKDGIALVVHAKNRVNTLNESQIISIYTGEIDNWQEVGGRDAPITVVSKAEGRSTLEVFLNHFNLKPPDIKPHVVIGDNQQGIKMIVANPNAIAYVSIGTAEFEAKHGTPMKLLTTDGVTPSVENVRNGLYPVSRVLNLVTKTIPKGLSKDFIEFSRSEHIGDLVEEQFFVQLRN